MTRLPAERHELQYASGFRSTDVWGNRRRRVAIMFLAVWPAAALAYAYALAIFEGIWGDPWYGYDWRSDHQATAYYLIGGPTACLACLAWWLVALHGVAGRWLFERPATLWWGVIILLYGLVATTLAIIILNDVMQTFFHQAFLY